MGVAADAAPATGTAGDLLVPDCVLAVDGDGVFDREVGGEPGIGTRPVADRGYDEHS
jgi:hypothetical protein